MGSQGPDASAVACPLCGAAAGESCHSKSGAPVDFHVARVKAAVSASPSPSASSSPPTAKRVDGVELGRLRRLASAGFDADRCALLGIRLDVGPRANRWHHPRWLAESVVSELAVAIVEAGAPPEALELAAARLADRGDS